MAARLTIWLYAHRVAVVEKERKNRLRLSYTEEALATYEGGTPLLSLALPLTRDRYPNGVTRAFLDGLLPEGEPRRVIAEDLGLPANDAFGLLAALGQDCAGALVILPEGDLPPPTPTTRTAKPLSADNLGELVANLRSAPLGIDRSVRLSLAGVQEKLLLTRLPDGTWGRPVGGTPSTHILKPEIERFQNTVENEAFCMRVASHLGLAVAQVETILVDERPVLVVEVRRWLALRVSCRTSPALPHLRRCCGRSPSTWPLATAMRTARTSRCCTRSPAPSTWLRSTTCCRRGCTPSTRSSQCTWTACRRPTG